jgi:hypothetical protein
MEMLIGVMEVLSISQGDVENGSVDAKVKDAQSCQKVDDSRT